MTPKGTSIVEEADQRRFCVHGVRKCLRQAPHCALVCLRRREIVLDTEAEAVAQAEMEKLRKELGEKVLTLLSAEQKQLWKEMQGKAFTFEPASAQSPRQ